MDAAYLNETVSCQLDEHKETDGDLDILWLNRLPPKWILFRNAEVVTFGEGL